jgi:hypothetical protein
MRLSKSVNYTVLLKMQIPALLLAIGASYLAAILFFLTLRIRSLKQTGIWVTLPLVLATPLFISSGSPGWRLLLSLNAVTIAAKMFDLWRDPQGALRFRLSSFIAYLSNAFCLVPRRSHAGPRPSFTSLLLRIFIGVAGLYLFIRILSFVWQIDWDNAPFLIEHLVKFSVVISLVWIVGFLGEAGWSLLGGKTTHLMGNLLTPHSPAEFWRRWNRPAQQFFYEDLFKPLARKTSPARATIIVFFINGLIHEYVFGIPINRFTGYFLIFFLIQGFAVMLTWRLRSTRFNTTIGVPGTLIFNALSSIVFFAGMNQLFPFYNGELPAWLAR